jgi:phosphoenolpyruvate synthase/pyruvate phosphate dikinase
MRDQQDTRGPVLLGLDDVRATCSALVGSKAAVLAALRSHGFAIPDGFVVSAEAYRSAVEAAGIEAALSYPVGLCQNACVESRFRSELLAQAQIPADMAEAIVGAYRELGRRVGRAEPVVAVRASVVGEEAAFGSTAPAFTGIVGRDRVTGAVAACWRTLFNERAIMIRGTLRQWFEPGMAVLVQQMVPTVRSGTAYSMDPVRRRPELVRITAARDERRSGHLTPTPDVYLVARRSKEVAELTIGQKPSRRSPFGHVLSDEEAEQVAATAVRAERVLRHPVAMDWSLGVDTTVVVLEVRATSATPGELALSRPAF